MGWGGNDGDDVDDDELPDAPWEVSTYAHPRGAPDAADGVTRVRSSNPDRREGGGAASEAHAHARGDPRVAGRRRRHGRGGEGGGGRGGRPGRGRAGRGKGAEGRGEGTRVTSSGEGRHPRHAVEFTEPEAATMSQAELRAALDVQKRAEEREDEMAEAAAVAAATGAEARNDRVRDWLDGGGGTGDSPNRKPTSPTVAPPSPGRHAMGSVGTFERLSHPRSSIGGGGGAMVLGPAPDIVSADADAARSVPRLDAAAADDVSATALEQRLAAVVGPQTRADGTFASRHPRASQADATTAAGADAASAQAGRPPPLRHSTTLNLGTEAAHAGKGKRSSVDESAMAAAVGWDHAPAPAAAPARLARSSMANARSSVGSLGARVSQGSIQPRSDGGSDGAREGGGKELGPRDGGRGHARSSVGAMGSGLMGSGAAVGGGVFHPRFSSGAWDSGAGLGMAGRAASRRASVHIDWDDAGVGAASRMSTAQVHARSSVGAVGTVVARGATARSSVGAVIGSTGAETATPQTPMSNARSSTGSVPIGPHAHARSSTGSVPIGPRAASHAVSHAVSHARSSAGGLMTAGTMARSSVTRARSGRDSAAGVSHARLTQGQGLVKPTLAAPTYVTRGQDTRHLL